MTPGFTDTFATTAEAADDVPEAGETVSHVPPSVVPAEAAYAVPFPELL
jgi:hypothetical protein